MAHQDSMQTTRPEAPGEARDATKTSEASACVAEAEEEKSKNTSTHDGAPQQQKPTHDPKVAIESAYRIDRYRPMHTASRLPRPLNRNGRCRVPPSLSILNALIS